MDDEQIWCQIKCQALPNIGPSNTSRYMWFMKYVRNMFNKCPKHVNANPLPDHIVVATHPHGGELIAVYPRYHGNDPTMLFDVSRNMVTMRALVE